MVAHAAVIGGVFLLTLLIVSVITVRISDMILDSRIGALDRTLGFLFGLGRGLVIVVVAFVFFAWLVPAGKQPEGVRNAKSRVVLENTGEWLQALLPQDVENYLSKWMKKKPDDRDAPPEAPGQRSGAGRAGCHRLSQQYRRVPAFRPHRHAAVDRRHTTLGNERMDMITDAETFDPNADRLREECGVFGIFGHPDAAAITALGLHALQHRGQEAAGIVSFDGKRFHSERRMGLVGDNFSRREVIDRLPGTTAVGHVRYSTTGETILRNVQPLFAELEGGGFAIGHNGNLTNGLALRRELVAEGAMMQSTTDTEVILHLVARAKRNRFVDRFVEGLRQLEGAYAFVGMTNKKLIGARDPLGIRPLVLGRLDGCPVLASETCALDIIGATYVRDVENGEVLVFDEDGAHSHKPFPPMPPRPCIFEYIYFARPDSIVGGRPVYDVRKAMGAQLAKEAPAAADVIVPVPDSGVPAALGFAQASGIPYELGIIRNHYVGRTFIEPTQQIRQLGVRLKHSANRAVVERQAHRAGRRLHRARHHLVEDRQDDARRGREGGALPHLLAADHASGLLRHRHAGARQAAWRRPTASRKCGSSSARTRSPSSRSMASTRRWATRRAIRCGRSSPTTASPANIRPASPTRPASRRSRGNCRCWRKPADRISEEPAAVPQPAMFGTQHDVF